MNKPDLEPFRSAERLLWHAWTVFDGDQPGRGGDMDGELRAMNGDSVAASLPLDIFTPAAVVDVPQRRGPWYFGDESAMGTVVTDPVSLDEAQEAIRAWCQQEIGRGDVTFSA